MVNITLLDLMNIAREHGCRISVATGEMHDNGDVLAVGVTKGLLDFEERWYTYEFLNSSETSNITILADIMNDIEELSEKENENV